MVNNKLIYACAARKAILKADPKLAYCIDAVPGVDAVEVVHGRWIKGKYPGEYTCEHCGFEYCEDDPESEPFKHCPECGSKNEQ